MLVKAIRAIWENNRHRVASELLRGTGSLILDVGCEDDDFIRKVGYGVGLDITSIKTTFPFVAADAQHLTFKDGTFDAVTCLEIVEHVEKPAMLVHEAHRVLKKNGLLVISAPETSLLWRVIWHGWSHTIGKKWADSHRNQFNKDELINLLRPYFIVEEVRRANFFVLTIRARASVVEGSNLIGERLFLILPTYMEAENLPILAKELRRFLNGREYEVLVVDDNSPDGTWKKAREAGFNVVVRPRKMGLASAFLEGVQHVEGELIGLMDADLQHPPEVLPLMLNEVYSGSDLVVASRYANGGKIEGWPLHRRLISRVAIALAHLLLSNTRAVKDPVSGFFIVKREVIEGAQLNPQGFKILLDILTKGKYGKVVEVPYTFKPREHGRSKFDFREIWSYIKNLYKLAHHILIRDHEKAIARNVHSLPPLTEKPK